MADVTVLNTSQFVAAEFDVTTANDPITALSAYLTQGVGNVGDQFTIDIYSTSNFTGRSNQRSMLYSTTGTFNTNGWNTAAMSWTPTSTGDYWVALQVSSTTQTRGLDLPGAGITTAPRRRRCRYQPPRGCSAAGCSAWVPCRWGAAAADSLRSMLRRGDLGLFRGMQQPRRRQ
jgi:hypothetical protein